jgi:hypothetical protein
MTTSPLPSRTMTMFRGNTNPGMKLTVPQAHQTSSKTFSSVPKVGPGST